MVPGLGFLYSGLARRKSALSLLWVAIDPGSALCLLPDAILRRYCRYLGWCRRRARSPDPNDGLPLLLGNDCLLPSRVLGLECQRLGFHVGCPRLRRW